MFYKLISHPTAAGKIYVSPGFYSRHFYGDRQSVIVRAGLRKSKVTVIPLSGLEENELKISGDILAELLLPTDIKYQIRVQGEEVCFGPVVGLLLAYCNSSFSPRRLEKFLDYALRYEELNGLLCIFGFEGINLAELSCEGYCYKPGSTREKPRWEKGIFPLPDSIFRRVNIPRRALRNLKELTGNCVFNTRFFNKWEFWEMTSKDPLLKDHVPCTKRLTSIEDIDRMLERFDSLYLKPVNGTLGNGQVKVSQVGGSYSFQGKLDSKPTLVSSREEAAEYVKSLISDGSYLVQQDIHLLKYEDRYVDFRVIMQKDSTLCWQCTSIIACTGAKGGIHSNYLHDGTYFSFEEFMSKALSLSETEIFKKRQEVIGLCKNTCRMLDASGENYGDFGVDIGFDRYLKPWIFEMNKSQFYYIPLMINDHTAYYSARTNPVQYAAALSGFNVEQHPAHGHKWN